MSAWSVLVVGPDDLLPAKDMLDAMRRAQALNQFILDDMEREGFDDHTPLCWAVPQRDFSDERGES